MKYCLMGKLRFWLDEFGRTADKFFCLQNVVEVVLELSH